jgi:hypothetical protein
MNNIEQDLGYSIKSYVKTLPLKKRELGVSLVDHLVKANIAEMDNHGYLRIHNMTKKVHVTDFLRAFLINNSKIETDLAGFYKQIASNLPKTFIKNKKLLSGTLIDGDGTYWDTLTT